MVKSMTGFGHAEIVNDARKLTVEIKSVNNRYLDMSIRMPKKYGAFESRIREVLKEYAGRGKVDVFITEEVFGSGNGEPVVNTELAKKYMAACESLASQTGAIQDINVSDLVKFPEVLTLRDAAVDEEELWNQLEDAVRAAAEKFDESRKAEGIKLRTDLEEKLTGMRAHVAEIEAHEPEIMTSYRQKLEDKLTEILGDRTMDESQLATALVIYSDKLSTDEETVRLGSHIDQMLGELGKSESVGRKLDFLAQEMNRESNTILSKAGDLATSNIGIEIKTVVEKIREQIQNIE
ncbi:MAG: YicC/YloC family endoribonuclease [Lachnospiraceae bacterium]|nr:YicC/YloC family endoribonuclease [Lachnospiraceae bacterium]